MQRPDGFREGRMEAPSGLTRSGQPSGVPGDADAGGSGAAGAPGASTGARVPGKRILLVEDNPSDVALFLRAFGRGRVPHSVVVAADGQEALDRLHGPGTGPISPPSEFPDLILLDLKLPKVDGLEVLRRVRQNPRTRRIPIVILSSSTEYADLSAGYDLGANGYIRKPVSFDQFLSAVECLGHYWLGLNESPPRAV